MAISGHLEEMQKAFGRKERENKWRMTLSEEAALQYHYAKLLHDGWYDQDFSSPDHAEYAKKGVGQFEKRLEGIGRSLINDTPINGIEPMRSGGFKIRPDHNNRIVFDIDHYNHHVKVRRVLGHYDDDPRVMLAKNPGVLDYEAQVQLANSYAKHKHEYDMNKLMRHIEFQNEKAYHC